MSVLGFRMLFGRGSLYTLIPLYLLIMILSDYQWWFWQIELFQLGLRREKAYIL